MRYSNYNSGYNTYNARNSRSRYSRTKKQSRYDKDVGPSGIVKIIVYIIGFILLFKFIKYGIEMGFITTF